MVMIFGASAKVYLKSEDDIEKVASRISKGLELPHFSVDFSEEEPFDLTGSCETLGFQIWLNKVQTIIGYNFIFEIATGLSHDELMRDRMHDLSPWLARYIARLCDIDAGVLDSNNNLTEFRRGDPAN